MIFRARMTRFLGVFVCLFVASVASEELSVCMNDTPTDCCLCSHTACDTDCPSPLIQLVTDNHLYGCEDSLDETTTSSVSMATSTDMETTPDQNYTNTTADPELLLQTDPSPRTRQNITVCLKKCPAEYYPFEKNCTKCHPACRTCNKSGSSGCIECMFSYNETCYTSCPDGTHSVDSRNCTATIKDDEEKKSMLAVIIGASAGGGVLVVIVIVGIVCFCCRRRQVCLNVQTQGTTTARSKRKTVMSGILEVKNGRGNKPKGNAMGSGGSRPDYENTAPKDNTLKQTIPTQGDVVLRYTKDPTESVKNNTLKPKQPVNHDSTYVNQSMISMMRNMSTEELMLETIEERLVIEALPEAPKVPGGVSESGSRVPQTKKKPSFGKRLSQKLINKKNRKPKGKDKQPVDTFGENYIDMNASGQSMEMVENETEEQEDYENTLKKKSKNQSKVGKARTGSEEELEDYENAPAKRNAQSKTSEEKTGDEGGLEDYEYMAEEKGKGAGEEAERKVTEREDNDLEDYENTKPLSRKGKIGPLLEKFETQKKSDTVVEKATDDDLEDYENVKPLSTKGKIKEELGNKQKPKKVKEVSKETENATNLDDLEDYENTSSLSRKGKPAVSKKEKPAVFKKEKPAVFKNEKTEQNVEESPYANMEIIRKTMKQRKA